MQPQQYYPRQEHGGVYHHHHHHPGYPIHHARMQWSPGVPGPWTAYDIAYSSYPPVSGHISSSIASDQTAATPHNIRDILGGNQPGGTLPSEVAKTPSYQKSPSSAGAATGTVFHYPPPGVDLRSPTTPNHPDIPQGFYIPAIPGRPFVGFDPSALSPDGLSLHGIPYHGQTHLSDPQGMPRGDKGGIPGSKDNRKDRKGRATFSGNQIDELEKAFQATQYLTHAERTKLAERLSLGENQVKIWFQNRRTKCRRTAWKGSKTPSVSSPTTPTAPPTSLSTSTPVTPTQPTPPTSSVATTTQ